MQNDLSALSIGDPKGEGNGKLQATHIAMIFDEVPKTMVDKDDYQHLLSKMVCLEDIEETNLELIRRRKHKIDNCLNLVRTYDDTLFRSAEREKMGYIPKWAKFSLPESYKTNKEQQLYGIKFQFTVQYEKPKEVSMSKTKGENSKEENENQKIKKVRESITLGLENFLKDEIEKLKKQRQTPDKAKTKVLNDVESGISYEEEKKKMGWWAVCKQFVKNKTENSKGPNKMAQDGEAKVDYSWRHIEVVMEEFNKNGSEKEQSVEEMVDHGYGYLTWNYFVILENTKFMVGEMAKEEDKTWWKAGLPKLSWKPTTVNEVISRMWYATCLNVLTFFHILLTLDHKLPDKEVCQLIFMTGPLMTTELLLFAHLLINTFRLKDLKKNMIGFEWYLFMSLINRFSVIQMMTSFKIWDLHIHPVLQVLLYIPLVVNTLDVVCVTSQHKFNVWICFSLLMALVFEIFLSCLFLDKVQMLKGYITLDTVLLTFSIYIMYYITGFILHHLAYMFYSRLFKKTDFEDVNILAQRAKIYINKKTLKKISNVQKNL